MFPGALLNACSLEEARLDRVRGCNARKTDFVEVSSVAAEDIHASSVLQATVLAGGF